MKQYSCIIPHYNEWKRLKDVVNAIKDITLITQIICIDDWSDERYTISKKIENYDQKVESYQIAHQGKTKAIQFGLKKVTNKDIILLDADLQNISKEELEKAIQYYEEKEFAMLIMVSNRPKNYIKYTNRHITLSGQRILPASMLRSVLDQYKPTKYQLETAINTYAIEKDLLIGFCSMSFENTQKTEKKEHSKISAIIKNIEMHLQIIGYTGMAHYTYVSLIIVLLYTMQKMLPFDLYRTNTLILFNIQYLRYIFQHIV